MTLTNPLKLVKWRLVVASLIAVGILHIIATFATPTLSGLSAFQRLKGKLPSNKMTVFPALSPDNQPLPFLSADVRYAMCRYDTNKAPVAVSAVLPDSGWSLALYSPEGDNFYVATGTQGIQTDLSILLVTSDERFMGLTPEARGLAPSTQAVQPIPARQGLAVVRAPDNGLANRGEVEAVLKKASCNAQPQ